MGEQKEESRFVSSRSSPIRAVTESIERAKAMGYTGPAGIKVRREPIRQLLKQPYRYIKHRGLSDLPGTLRRTTLILSLEATHGKALDQILREAYREKGSIKAVAESLGVARGTIKMWVAMMRLRETHSLIPA